MKLATKTLLACTAAAAFVGSAQAATINVTSVGTINGNSRTTLEATGNSSTQAAFATDVAAAFAGDTGGVIDFEGDNFALTNNDVLAVAYGTSGTQTLNLTFTSDGNAGSSAQSNEATSGSKVFGLNSPAGAPRTFTPDTALLSVSIFSLDRNAVSRIPALIVTYQDNTTATTSGADADNWYFHSLSGTAANPIVSFTIDQNNFIRYDDLGFIVVPEPGSMALLGLGGLLIGARRRRG